jgi:hypothetical protein
LNQQLQELAPRRHTLSSSLLFAIPHPPPGCALHSNDAFDADTGVDKTKPESVVNLTGNRPAVLLLSKAFLAAGVAALSWGISSAADPAVAPLLGAAICCGYLYQGPPFRCVWGAAAAWEQLVAEGVVTAIYVVGSWCPRARHKHGVQPLSGAADAAAAAVAG